MNEDEIFDTFEEEHLSSTEVEDTESYYTCNLCKVSFTNLDEHMSSFHENQRTALNDENSKDNDDNDFDGIALVMTDDGKFKCTECPKKFFKSFKRFVAHMKGHKTLSTENIKALEDHVPAKDLYVKNQELCEADGNVWLCKMCNSKFDNRKAVLLHVVMHKNSEEALSQSSQVQSATKNDCKLCNKSFNESYEYEMHMNAHKENKTSQGVKNRTTKKAGSAKGSHACQFCGKEFSRPHEKVKHERVHTNEKPYACDQCDKKFRVSYCLSLHKRNVHSDERPYVCTFPGCNKRFKAQGVYNHHLNTHGTEKKYKCPHCPKSFKTSVQLAGHKNTHTKPFSCNFCQRVFSSLYAAKNHIATHQKGGSLKYECQICGVTYARSHALNDHVKAQHPDSNADEEVVEEYVIEEEETNQEDQEVYSVVME